MRLENYRQLRRQRQPNRKQKAIRVPQSAPVGGWNARDGIDEMKPEEAIDLVNFFPGQGECVLRKGSTSHSTGLGGGVEALAEFNAGTTRKLIAGANGKLWDASAAGAGAQLATGFVSNRWQASQFDDAGGGARLGFVNGTDAPQIFNGSAVVPMTISGLGLTPSTFSGINVHRSRTYFWDHRTQDFWYSKVNALGGELTKFPLGRVAGTGGNLIAMGTWTKDGGDGGTDDLAVFLLSSGDVVIYAGDNPGNSLAWELVGIFKVGAPLSTRGLTKVGADLIVITTDGYIPLAKVLAHERSVPGEQLSDKIRKAVLAATRLFAGNFGWQAIHYPAANMALFNVPLGATLFEQHVVNTLTGAWCKFKGMNARCWAMFNDRLYFGGGGKVLKADDGTSDDGANIVVSAQTSWNYLRSRRQEKEFVGIRPLLELDGPLTFSAGVGVDFGPVEMTATTAAFTGAPTPWDTTPWDVAPWSNDFEINQHWLGAGGLGYGVSTKLEFSTATRAVKWLGLHYLYKPGKGSL